MKNVAEIFTIFSKDSNAFKNKSIATDKELIMKLQSGEYNLVIDQARYPLNSLSSIFENYDLQPEYQRNKVWDIGRKSKLIESLIINVPIPPIFLYEIDYNSFEVMDGLQRISTIIDFFNNGFALKDLEIWPELNGKKFSELLPEFQKSIKRRYLSASIVLKESTVEKQKENNLKKIVFERLNTGGIKLSQQEIRNALDSSEVNKMINSLGDSNEKFLLSWNYPKPLEQIKEEIDRMDSREMILRFFAYKDSMMNDVKKGTRTTLDLYSSRVAKYGEEKAMQLEKYFNTTLDIAFVLFGLESFNKKKDSKSEKMIFDTVMLACSLIVDNEKEKVILEQAAKYDLEKNNKLKNKYFDENKDLFNGKYTSLSKVSERYKNFYDHILSEII